MGEENDERWQPMTKYLLCADLGMEISPCSGPNGCYLGVYSNHAIVGICNRYQSVPIPTQGQRSEAQQIGSYVLPPRPQKIVGVHEQCMRLC